jgi:hypothetical protein
VFNPERAFNMEVQVLLHLEEVLLHLEEVPLNLGLQVLLNLVQVPLNLEQVEVNYLRLLTTKPLLEDVVQGLLTELYHRSPTDTIPPIY